MPRAVAVLLGDAFLVLARGLRTMMAGGKQGDERAT